MRRRGPRSLMGVWDVIRRIQEHQEDCFLAAEMEALDAQYPELAERHVEVWQWCLDHRDPDVAHGYLAIKDRGSSDPVPDQATTGN